MGYKMFGYELRVGLRTLRDVRLSKMYQSSGGEMNIPIIVAKIGVFTNSRHTIGIVC